MSAGGYRPKVSPLTAPAPLSAQQLLSRRRFLIWTAGLASAVSGLWLRPRGLLAQTEGNLTSYGARSDDPLVLRHRPHPSRDFAPFPSFDQTGIYGAGTYRGGPPDLLGAALAAGVTLLDTSPDYRKGEAEAQIGEALRHFEGPVFVMTQIPTEAWEQENRPLAFRRAFERSLHRLHRDHIEALLVRNAEPQQIEDPAFRDFARELKEQGFVQHIGASGHGPDTEKILETGLEDDLLDLYLVGAHLARVGNMESLLRAARERGKLLIAMKSREAALWARIPGWDREEARRLHAPWDGNWDFEFTRRGLAVSLETTGAHNAVLSLRRPEDLAAIVPD